MGELANFTRGLIWGAVCGAVIIALVVLTQGCGQELNAPPHSRLVKSIKEKGGAISEGTKEKGGAISEDARERSGAVTRKGKAIGMGAKEKQNSAVETYHDCIGGGCDLREAMRGPDGKKGNTGATGSAGEDGQDGADGSDGNDGASGMDGADGQDGLDGSDGQDGQDGEDGIDGEDGERGPRGFRGRRGASGDDGEDGSSCEIEREVINCYRRGRRYKEWYNVSVVCGEDSELLATKYRYVEECSEEDD